MQDKLITKQIIFLSQFTARQTLHSLLLFILINIFPKLPLLPGSAFQLLNQC